MFRKIQNLLFISYCLVFIGCYSMKPSTSIVNGHLKDYSYVYIAPTNLLTSGSGIPIGGKVYTHTKTVNSVGLISGILSKRFLRLNEVKHDLVDETSMVNYRESGRRNTGLGGYTIEVTIQFI